VAGSGPGGEKSALARVAIVDWNGDVLLDTFVKPQEKVPAAAACRCFAGVSLLLLHVVLI
jgi:RNA exonuclease 4